MKKNIDLIVFITEKKRAILATKGKFFIRGLVDGNPTMVGGKNHIINCLSFSFKFLISFLINDASIFL